MLWRWLRSVFGSGTAAVVLLFLFSREKKRFTWEDFRMTCLKRNSEQSDPLSRTVWQPNNTSSGEFRTSRLHCFPKRTENEFGGWWDVVSSTTVFVEFSTRAGQLYELLSGSQNSKLLKFCSPVPLEFVFWSGSRCFQVLRVFFLKSSGSN